MKTKKFFIYFLVVISIVFPLTTLAGDLPNAPTIGSIPGVTFNQFLLNIVDWVWKLFSVVAVLLFIYAGILFLTASGNESQVSTAKKAAIWGVAGVAVAIVGFSIIAIVQGSLGLNP